MEHWKKIKLAVLFLMISAIMMACGGSGGSSTPTPTVTSKTISGIAAAGSPIIGNVTIKDSSIPAKTKIVPIAADGKYTVDVSDLTAPFMFNANGNVGGSSYSIYSAGVQADIGGTINITPLTDLIVANVAKDLAKNYFDSGNFSSLTSAALATQATALQTKLAPILQAIGVSGSIDLLRTSFSTNHSGLDAALDIIKVTTDPTTKVATLTNVISNESITNNVVSQVITGSLTNTAGISSKDLEFNAIKANFQSVNTLFATSLPSPSNSNLLQLFDQSQSAFLFGGMDINRFLTFLTSDPNFIGISFGNVTLLSMSDTLDSATVSLTISFNGRVRKICPSWTLVKSGNNWVSQGDRKIMMIDVNSGALYGDQIYTGVSFNFDDFGGIGITSVEISGPGITGIIKSEINISHTTFHFDHAVYPNSFDGQLFGMTDSQIASIPASNAVYQLKIYAGTKLLTTYNEPLRNRPYLSGQLSQNSFMRLTSPTTAALHSFKSGNLTYTWTLPSGFSSSGVAFEPFVEAKVKPTDTSYTFAFPNDTSTTSRWGWLYGFDSNNVAFTTYIPID